MDDLRIMCVWFLMFVIGVSHAQINTQQDLDKMAAGLRITYDVTTNTKDTNTFQIEVGLQNEAVDVTLTSDRSWAIHFTHVFMLEPTLMGIGGNKSVEIPGQFVELTHVQGSHFYLKALDGFLPVGPGGGRKIKMTGALWSVAQTDVMPNWYMTSSGLEPRVISSTSGEKLLFATPKTSPATWKRYNYDEYNPYTAQERYERNYVKHRGDITEIRVIPKPRHVKMDDVTELQWIPIDRSWSVVYHRDLENEAAYLSRKLGVDQVLADNYAGDNTKVIKLSVVDRASVDDTLGGDTQAYYTLDTTVSGSRVDVTGVSATGVFYGAVTLIELWDEDKGLPECSIQDSPRFEYRGVMVDVSRNFHRHDEIIALLKLMGRYKLNKLHLHLTDDEGWRLEIPSLPELTELGSKRCHDMTETECLLPQIGSGPGENSLGNGFYTSDIYKDILREAVRQHVELIPEFDMPGHARAAIKAMELRMDRLSKRGPVPPQSDVTLQEQGDNSKYTTPQSYTDNAINPCLDSTYNFVGFVLDEIINLHKDIQPLKVFHFGGDEVGKGAWVNSTICARLNATGRLPGESPKELFFQKVSEMAKGKGLGVAAWEDGVMKKGNQPFNLSTSDSPTTYAYCWDNVWEWGTTPRTYHLANLGYKVIMAHGSHLYFDHPYEPAPEERGYYWATRFTDTKKTFAYNAHDLYANIEYRLSGKPISDEEKCEGDPEVSCPTLKKTENIVGMQAVVFSETTRTQEQLHDRLFPRLLAAAERAWHEAEWERLPKDGNYTRLLSEDWISFAQAVGHRELPRLEKESIEYRLPPPGAKLSFGRLLTSALYSGLVVEYSLDFEKTWKVAGPLVWLGEGFKYRVWLRTRSMDGKRFSRSVVLYPDLTMPVTTQPTINYIAKHLDVQFKVDDNYKTYGDKYFAVTFTLTNTCDTPIPTGNWAIYFSSVRFIESEFLSQGHRYVDPVTSIYFEHVNGYLFRMGPSALFNGLPNDTSIDIHVKIDGWSVSRYEQMPRWYVSAPGMQAKDIENTNNEELSFVAPFSTPDQWKRAADDLYNPWTPAARFDRNKDLGPSAYTPNSILPTPVTYKQITGSVSMTSKPWVVYYGAASLKPAADYLKEMLPRLLQRASISVSNTMPKTPPANSIQVSLGQVNPAKNVSQGDSAYRVKVDGASDVINIVSPSPHGVFYGVVTLIQLSTQSGRRGQVTGCDVIDWPRFGYRGMYADVSRNFMPKAEILKLLDAMALYKLNKFHIHLCDDEGWRLEIPGIPELTEVGGKRCHDPEETECVMSTLGSGATSDNYGSGFYTVEDYREILRYAESRQIEVIPEFDMPGHSHAAVKAMRERRRRMMDLGESKEVAEEWLLDDLEDPSQYFSVQLYNDNAVNPCINSTYSFVQRLLTEVISMHRDIQPLKVYHFGGDEVPHTTWLESPSCQSLLGEGVKLKEEFTRRVSALTSDLTLAAWEDGLMHDGKPWERNQLANKDVIGYAWNNVWEWEEGRRAYLLANAGYQVVLSPVTHMYFDHPSEPSPEERGFYWGTRYTDVFKAFAFMPDDYYMNIDVTILGHPITKETVCEQHDGHGCPPLEKPENVIGMQGQLWTETVRLPSQSDFMNFPRLLALAERAWHKASWEGKPRDRRRAGLMADKARFAHLVGTTHLPLLERLGIEYRVPPPGARQEGDKLVTNTEFPGLKVMYKIDNSQWRPLSKTTTFSSGQEVTLKTLSHDSKRSSREVKVTIVHISRSDNQRYSVYLVILSLFVCLSSIHVMKL